MVIKFNNKLVLKFLIKLIIFFYNLNYFKLNGLTNLFRKNIAI